MAIKLPILGVSRFVVDEGGRFVALTLDTNGTEDGAVVVAMEAAALDGLILAATDARTALKAQLKTGADHKVFCRPIKGYQIAAALERPGFVIASFHVAEGASQAFLISQATAHEVGKKLVSMARVSGEMKARAGQLAPAAIQH